MLHCSYENLCGEAQNETIMRKSYADMGIFRKSDEERAKIGLYVPQAIKNVRHLIVAEINGSLVAFSGIEGKKTEMLFVAPENRGTGVGKALIGYAAERFEADTVTVNEQNPQAVGFYRHMGFETYRRTELDEQGNAYPILYMKKA